MSESAESKHREISLQGVIFDLDGTLLDTVADIGGAANQALNARGLRVHETEAYRDAPTMPDTSPLRWRRGPVSSA